MTDIVLVNAPWKKDHNRSGRWGGRTISMSMNPPIYFLYAAAVLEARGHTVKIVDALAEGLSLDETVNIVKREAPEICVIESNCASIKQDLECAESMKLAGVKKVGLAGMMATSSKQALLKENPYLDFSLIGEYDYTLSEVLENLDNLEALDGVAWRKESSILFNPKTRYIEDLDELPYPAYHLVKNELYDEIIIQKRPFVQSVESRSCPYNCSMCISHIMFGRKWRSMCAERVVDEMEYWEDKGFKEVFWDGETFTVDRNRVLKICKLIKDRGLGISWSCLSRADTVDKEVLYRMAEANCVLIRYGFESATQEILDFIRKGNKVEQINDASNWTRDVGILVHGTWMFVPPVETEESAVKTIELAKKTSDTAQFTICTPYYGTDYHKLCKDMGILTTEDWSEYMASDRSVIKSDIDFGGLVRKAYTEFYLRPSYVFKTAMEEARKGTLNKSFNIMLRMIGAKKYW